MYIGPINEGQANSPEGGVTRFVPIIIGSQLRVPLESADEGEPYAYMLSGRYEMPKKAATELLAGGSAYYDPENEEFTNDNTKFPAGVYPEGAAADDETVIVSIYPAGTNDAELTQKADISALPLAGSVTITGTETTADVLFDSELSNTDYAIILTNGDPTGLAKGNEAPWYTSKATTGFTVNITTAPDGTDTARIDWLSVPFRDQS